jgi:hypothetical protein
LQRQARAAFLYAFCSRDWRLKMAVEALPRIGALAGRLAGVLRDAWL